MTGLSSTISYVLETKKSAHQLTITYDFRGEESVIIGIFPNGIPFDLEPNLTFFSQKTSKFSLTNAEKLQEFSYSDWQISPVHMNIVNLDQWSMKFQTIVTGERTSYIKRTVIQPLLLKFEIPQQLICILDSLDTHSPAEYDILLNNHAIQKWTPGKILRCQDVGSPIGFNSANREIMN